MATDMRFIKEATTSTSVTDLSITDCFDSRFRSYYVSIIDLDMSVQDYFHIRVINASGVDSGTNYENANHQLKANTTYSQQGYTGTDTYWRNIAFVYGAVQKIGMGIWIYNPNATNSFTHMKYQNVYDINNLYGNKGIGYHKVNEQITGLNFKPNTGTIDSLTVKVFGIL